MRKLLFVLAAFVCFADPNEQGIWIVASQVVSLLQPTGCAGGSNTKIITSAGSLCVREKPQQVIKLLEQAKEK